MQVWTDFREYARGRKPEDWTEPHNPVGACRIEGQIIDPSHRNYLDMSPGFAASAAAERSLAWGAVGTVADAQIRALVRPRLSGNGGSAVYLATLVIRGGGTAAAPSGYRLIFSPSLGQVRVDKIVAGAATVLGTISRPILLDSYYWVVFQAIGTDVAAYVWPFGEPDPGWQVFTSDSSLTSGWVGVRAGAADESWECHHFGVGTGGSAAPTIGPLKQKYPEGGEPIEIWSRREDELLEVTARVEHRDPSTDALVTEWLSNLNRRTGPSDYPASTVFKPLLVDTGALRQALQMDAVMSPQIGAEQVQLKFKNAAPAPNGAGPLDHWIQRSFAGRSVELRIGRRWATKPSPTSGGVVSEHRHFDLVSSPVALQEPTMGDEITLPVANRPASLARRVPARRYVGIATGVEAIAATGFWTIPSHASYSRNGFLVMLRLYVPTAGVPGASGSTISSRLISGGSGARYQWLIQILQASHATQPNRLRFVSRNSADTASLMDVYTPSGVNLGRFIDVLFGVNGSSEYFVNVDGVSISRGALASNPYQAAASVVVNSAPTCMLFDHRIEKFVAEEEALSRFAARRDPDQYNLAMHRADDGLLNTVTDYNPTANHATLGGADGVDRRWSPTYLGTLDLAGAPMPISGGARHNVPAQLIDGNRSIFRYNDRAATSGTLVTPRIQGLQVGGSIYTEPAGGVIDGTGAVALPVTVGLRTSVAGSVGLSVGTEGWALVGTNTAYNFTTGAFTFEGWFYFNSLSNSPVLASRGAFNTDGWYVQVTTAGALQLVTNQAGASQLSRSTNTIVTGRWYHLAVTRNGAAVRIYISGTDFTSIFGAHVNPVGNAARNLYLGRYESAGTNGLNGRMTQPRIWNVARSPADLAAQMWSILPAGYSANLIGNWPTNEASGAVLYDLSATAANAALAGGYSWSTDFPVESFARESVNLHVPKLLKDELIAREGVTRSELDTDSFDALRALLPYRGGFQYNEAPTVAEFLGKPLSNLLAHYALDNSGRIYAGILLPPVGGSPYSGDPHCLEFGGHPGRGVTLAYHSTYQLPVSGQRGSIAAVFQMPRNAIDKSKSIVGGAVLTPDGQTIVEQGDMRLAIDGSTGLPYFGMSGCVVAYMSWPSTWIAPQAGEWWFFCGGYVPGAPDQLYVEASRLTPSFLDMGSQTLSTGASQSLGGLQVPLTVGYGKAGPFTGSVAQVVTGDWLSSVFFTPLIQDARIDSTNPSWGSVKVALHLNEGIGDGTLELKTGNRYAYINGARWTPRLVLDLRRAVSAQPGSPRRPIPAWRVEARYRHNDAVLESADFVASVPAVEKLALGTPFLSIPDASNDIRSDYNDGRDVVLETPLEYDEGARAVAKLGRTRLSPDRRFMDVNDWHRELLRLRVTDEVLVYHPRWEASGRYMRVHTLVLNLLAEARGTIGNWG